MAKDEMAFINVQLERELKEKFEEKTLSEERTVSQAVRLLIKNYLGEDD